MKQRPKNLIHFDLEVGRNRFQLLLGTQAATERFVRGQQTQSLCDTYPVAASRRLRLCQPWFL